MSPAEFLQTQHEEILAEWALRSHSLADAKALPGLVLLDHMPHFLDELVKRLGGSLSRTFEAVALEHAVERCRHGVPLREVVTEYAILRDVIKKRRSQQGGEPFPATFDQTFDEAMEETMDLYRRAGEESARRDRDRPS
jgi:RsbT co-antagonist protein rsbRD N-terminal domain